MDSATSSARPERRNRRLLRLRTLLIAVNLIILATVILGFWTARFYESELLRQTEIELHQQGELVRATFMEALDASALSDARLSHPITDEDADGEDDGRRDEQPNKRLNIHRARLYPPSPLPEPGMPVEAPIAEAGDRAHRILGRAWTREKGSVSVVERRGVVIASTNATVGASIANRREIQDALTGRASRILRRCDITPSAERSERCLVLTLPIVHEGRVLGAVLLSQAPLGQLTALALHARVVVVWLVVIVVAMIVQLWYTSQLIVTPINELIAQSERLARGERESLEVLDRPITLEVERLSEAVVAMARALDERAEYIRAFASNVSHEFKTPLSSIRGSVELLEDLGDTMPPADRERFLGMIDRHAERLQRLVGRLMELARADVERPGSIATSPAPTLKALAERFRAEGMSIALDLDGLGDATTAMRGVTLDTVIGNLVSNARQHVGPEVQLQIRARIEGDNVLIEVEDDGLGISEANRERIFTPFFTTARDHGGTGVGLSIVAALVRAHDGSVTLPDGLPTRFQVRLPRWLS